MACAVKSCCGCLSLRTGVLIIGTLLTLWFTFRVVTAGLALTWLYMDHSHPSNATDNQTDITLNVTLTTTTTLAPLTVEIVTEASNATHIDDGGDQVDAVTKQHFMLGLHTLYAAVQVVCLFFQIFLLLGVVKERISWVKAWVIFAYLSLTIIIVISVLAIFLWIHYVDSAVNIIISLIMIYFILVVRSYITETLRHQVGSYHYSGGYIKPT